MAPQYYPNTTVNTFFGKHNNKQNYNQQSVFCQPPHHPIKQHIKQIYLDVLSQLQILLVLDPNTPWNIICLEANYKTKKQESCFGALSLGFYFPFVCFAHFFGLMLGQFNHCPLILEMPPTTPQYFTSWTYLFQALQSHENIGKLAINEQ